MCTQLRLDGRPRTAGGNKQQEHWWTSEGYRDIETATRVIEHAPKPSSGNILTECVTLLRNLEHLNKRLIALLKGNIGG